MEKKPHTLLSTELLDSVNIVAEPENRMTMLYTDFFYKEIYAKRYRGGLPSLSMLEESIQTECGGINFMPFSPFFESFNENIGEMNSNGLTDYWVTTEFDRKKGRKFYNDEIGAQVLTLDHLEICFLICLIPMVLATIAFIVECSIPRIRAANKKFKEILTAFFVVRTFIEFWH